MHRITIESKDARALANELESRIRSFNERHSGPLKTQPLALSVRLDDRTLIAGLVGESFWNVLYVDILWVDEPYRRKGCGSALLRRAEAVAQERLCEAVYLSTFTFQAPEFYSRQGYEIIGELPGVPRGSARKWFYKPLPDASMQT